MDVDDSIDPKEVRATLETYKKLAQDFANHDTILKDKTVLSYVAYVLEAQDFEIIELGIDILELFVKNVDNYVHITSTFGVREALDAVINKYNFDEPKIAKRAQCIKDDIERMKPPIYNLRSRCRRVIEPKKLKTHVIVLHVQGLLPETRSELESTLIRIDGLVSLVVDVEHQRVTMRTLSYVTAKQIAEAIHNNTENMEARLVTRNKLNQEYLVKLIHTNGDNGDTDDMPDYLPEEEEQEEKEGVVSLFTGLRQSASSLYKSTTEFLQNSFYW
ncbi:armadillo repeat-containing protein 1 isoform X2 [Nomia melanderi]|nr:armadillo repeat-containing protein 1-like isoform X2 [Nomia melanderi]XP_031826295.1 armadillo repeat-containing protein 1-like isoform X2 [Nomia melanderi]XP_031826296.1 armadillo repeat-containing protein 1-like isoform X2 [Nomia melanderi]XP_031826298.1 armadillo repeat-containing protein 1-like isoform X2 [Nomia melanderi]XP_031826299.1 armadillo repeat-containing protein 1-like isoform X2 [Nomia melanderi]XP_031826300.1 armadillo repeat-containing protein 1-like isoform X2 [Nomia mela